MRRAAALALVAAAGLFAAPAGADDKDKGNPFEAWEKVGRPGPQHKLLERMAGSWTYTSKMWMEPGKDPVESRGTAERRMVMGGRYLADDVKGEMFGKQFHGHGVTGYDNAQQKYVGAWVDNFGTGISHSEGTADESGKVLTFTREDYDPAEKAKAKAKDVIRLLSDDKQVMEMYKILPDGKEVKVMEITFTRKPAAKSGD
jgi:hypothetical protein